MQKGKQQIIKVAMADDHTLMRKAIAWLIQSFPDAGRTYQVIIEADNGRDLLEKIDSGPLPDLILLDVSMPGMDGYQAMDILKKRYPKVKVLVLSMSSNPETIALMMQKGAHGYMMKNSEPDELRLALENVMTHGFYYTEYVTTSLLRLVKEQDQLIKKLQRQNPAAARINFPDADTPVNLTEKEKEFLLLLCGELSYKEIAERMFVSPRTVDNYRDTLYEKVNVKTRVGLVLYAIRHNMLEIA